MKDRSTRQGLGKPKRRRPSRSVAYLGPQEETAARLEEPTPDGAPSAPDLAERTLDYALRIVRVYRALPKRGEAAVLGNQLLRSGTSVGANYREARRARSDAELAAKLGDCLKEADETGYWLTLLVRAGIVPARKLELMIAESDELTRIFYAGRETLRRSASPKRP